MNVLHCYVRGNSTQIGYRKRMKQIWEECTGYRTTKFAEQAWAMIKKG